MSMIFDTAKRAVLPFGQHRGKTIEEVASTTDGLLYLDRLIGWERLHSGFFKDALAAFLADESIQKDISAAMADRKFGRQQWR